MASLLFGIGAIGAGLFSVGVEALRDKGNPEREGNIDFNQDARERFERKKARVEQERRQKSYSNRETPDYQKVHQPSPEYQRAHPPAKEGFVGAKFNESAPTASNSSAPAASKSSAPAATHERAIPFEPKTPKRAPAPTHPDPHTQKHQNAKASSKETQ